MTRMQRTERVVRHRLASGEVKEYRYPIKPPRRKRVAGDTVGALIEAWQRSPEWQALAESSRRQYARYIGPFMGMQHVQAARVERRQIIAIRNAVAQTRGNGAANAFGRAVSAMFAWGLEAGWVKFSPVARIKMLKLGELPTWSQEELDAALAVVAEPIRRALILAVFTGQRCSDLVKMTWVDYSGTAIGVKQQKTGTPLVVACHPDLKQELDRWKEARSTTTILANSRGRPWTANGLTKQVIASVGQIDGFPRGRGIHGLRKLAAVKLAEAGCSVFEIAAITGHRSVQNLEIYTRAAEQKRLAERAILRLVNGAMKKEENG